MHPNPRYLKKLELIRPFLGNTMKDFPIVHLLWKVIIIYLVTAASRAGLKRSLSRTSMRDNRYSSMKFPFTPFIF